MLRAAYTFGETVYPFLRQELTLSGYLGQNEATLTPLKVVFFDKLMEIAQVSCGNSHVAVLSCKWTGRNKLTSSVQGEIYTFGNGAHGQLGHGDTKDRYSPEIIQGLLNKHISFIACGAYTTIGITGI